VPLWFKKPINHSTSKNNLLMLAPFYRYLTQFLFWGGLFYKSEIIPKIPDLGNASEGKREKGSDESQGLFFDHFL
jgi:hypothetical protein